MLLALDMGNTNITVGVFDGKRLIMESRLATDHNKMEDSYAIDLCSILALHGVDVHAIDGAVLSSVVPPLDHRLRGAVRRITGVSPLDDSRSGDGLGVRVAQRVVELHGGRTLLETAAATATLCVSLPLTSPHPAATKLHSPATAPSPFAADSAATSRTLDRKVLTAFSSLLSKDYYNLSEKY